MTIIDFLLNNSTVLLILAINFTASIFYYFIINNDKMKNGFFNLPIVIQKFYVLLGFVCPLFISPFIVQAKLNLNFIAIPIFGIVLAVTGLSFIILSFFKIGVIPSIKSKSGLSTTGIYKIIRHPIYGGTIILFLGLILFQQSVITLLYFPISVVLYFCMTIFEEKDLIKIYGNEYIEYKNKVKKRFIPFIL